MGKIEAKVLIPAISGLIVAALALAAAFGLDLTPDQQTAILGASTAVIVLLQAALGYAAPHTNRPDLVGTTPLWTGSTNTGTPTPPAWPR